MNDDLNPDEWENIFQTIANPIWILDSEYHILKINRAAVDAMTMSKEELKSKKCYEIFHDTEEPPEACPVRQLLDSKDVETEEVKVGALNGTYLISCTPVLDENGDVQKVIHMGTDITERKRLEREREQAREEAEFYADVLAHDVGNLNQVVLGYLTLLQKTKNEEKIKKNVKGIKNAVMSSKRLAENIKTLQKLDDLELTAWNFNGSLQKSIERIKDKYDREIQIRKNLGKKYTVHANEFLNIVFVNILENAVEYTFQDPVKIDISAEKRKNMCYVHIHDYGIGISEEKRKDLLENLDTLSKRTGLGLYTVKKILNRYNGSFTIHSAEKGTEIVVHLPLHP